MADYRRCSSESECSDEFSLTEEQIKEDVFENEFSSPWTFGDITLEVEGRQLYASKSVLRMVSPVFNAMFRDDVVEKKTSTVKLPGKKYTDVVEFLRCVHPHVGKDVREEWLEVLLSLADEYQCQTLETKCQEFLVQRLESSRLQRQAQESSPAFQTVLHWLKLADQFHLDQGLVEKLANELVAKIDLHQLKKEDDYKRLDSTPLRFVLSAYVEEFDQGRERETQERIKLQQEVRGKDYEIRKLERQLRRL